MPLRDGKLGVGVSGIGWCAAQHIVAFNRNPQASVTWLHGRDLERTRATLNKHDLSLPAARLTTRFEDLLEAPDVDIISIATPNHLHADQAVAAARAGKHIVLEKPTGEEPEGEWEQRFLTTVKLVSRTDADPRLTGTKHRAADTREVWAVKGRRDGRTIVMVPEVKHNQTVGLTLLHVRFADRLGPAPMRAVVEASRVPACRLEISSEVSHNRAPERSRASSLPEAWRSSTRPRVATTDWRGLPSMRLFLTICRYSVRPERLRRKNMAALFSTTTI